MQVAKDSPLQISSFGTYLGRKFQIKELLHKLTSALVWNEWQIEFEDSEKAWIKEAQGTWAIFYFRSLDAGWLIRLFVNPLIGLEV